MRKTVYVETTIPSFYYEMRPEPDAVARRDWTRQWWERHSASCELVTSEAVFDELGAGEYPQKEEAIRLLDPLPVLYVDGRIVRTAQVYLVHRLMPQDLFGDAMHLAFASHYKCDILLTWNCDHLANVNKFEHIRNINTMLGLFTPTIVTPLEMLGEETGDEG